MNYKQGKTITQTLQGLSVIGENRLRDFRDWAERHDVPDGAHVSLTLWEKAEPRDMLKLHLPFSSYKLALRWLWLHTKCLEPRYGVDARKVFSVGNSTDSYGEVQMPDFLIIFSFPTSTHPDLNQ